MSKIKIIKILSLTSIILLTSCWDRMELSNMILIEGLGVDIVDGRYEVSLVIISNLEASDQKRGDAPFIVYSGKGDSIIEAFKNIYPQLGFHLYYKHIQYLIISESVAKEHLEEVIEEIVRGDVRYNTHIYIVKDYTAKEALSIFPKQYTYTTVTFEIMADNAYKNQVRSYYDMILDVHRDIMLKGQDLAIPVIKIYGDDIEKGFSVENNTTSQPDIWVEVSDLGIFNNNKLVDITEREETMGLGIAYGKISSPVFSFIYKNECRVSIQLTSGSSEKTVKVNNDVESTISVNVKGFLKGFSCDDEIIEPKIVNKLEVFIEDELEKLIKKGIKKTQSVGSDVLGIGELVRRKDNEYWLENEDKWNDVYKTIPISINIDFTLEDIGVFTKVYKKE